MFLRKMTVFRGGSRTSATSKVELFVTIVNGIQSLIIITKSSTLDVAAVQDRPLILFGVAVINKEADIASVIHIT